MAHKARIGRVHVETHLCRDGTDSMTTRTLTEAIFRLGRISTSGEMTNASLLKGLADLSAQTLAADVVALAVFERGVEHPAASTYVRGPWNEPERDRFLEQAQWTFDERGLGERLMGLRRGRLYHRPEMFNESDPRAAKQFEVARPLPMGDQAAGLYRRSDGVELLVSIHKLSRAGLGASGPFTRAQLARAGALAPFVAQCWAASWRHEPQWMTDLKPQARGILEHLLMGYDDDQIADLSGLSYHSVRAHLKRLFRDAGVRSRLHLMQTCQSLRAGSDLTVELPTDDSLTQAIG